MNENIDDLGRFSEFVETYIGLEAKKTGLDPAVIRRDLVIDLLRKAIEENKDRTVFPAGTFMLQGITEGGVEVCHSESGKTIARFFEGPFDAMKLAFVFLKARRSVEEIERLRGLVQLIPEERIPPEKRGMAE